MVARPLNKWHINVTESQFLTGMMADAIKKCVSVEFYLLVSLNPSHKYYKHMQSYAGKTHKPMERFRHKRRKTRWNWTSIGKVALKRYTNSRLVTTGATCHPCLPAMHNMTSQPDDSLCFQSLCPIHPVISLLFTCCSLLVPRALWASWYRINRRGNRAGAAQRLGNRLFRPILFDFVLKWEEISVQRLLVKTPGATVS